MARAICPACEQAVSALPFVKKRSHIPEPVARVNGSDNTTARRWQIQDHRGADGAVCSGIGALV